MRVLAFAIALAAATPGVSQECFVDTLPAPNAAETYNAKMRALMMAHVPIEYRNSCGFLDGADQAYFEAIRAQVGCTESEAYEEFFGRFLQDAESYAFAVKRTDLRSDADFDLYCQIVERIDLTGAVNADGTVNVQNLQANAPLFQALSQHLSETKWDQ